MRTSIWLVRAGQSRANAERRFHGQADSPLTALGSAQSAQVAVQLRRQRIDAVYCAPQRATVQSAALLAPVCRSTPVIEAGWADQGLGVLTGLTRAAAHRDWPQSMADRLRDPLDAVAPGGEALATVAERIVVAWQQLVTRHRGQRVVIVTQATPIQIILCALVGTPLLQHWSWRIDNGSSTCVDLYGTTPIIRCVNATTALARADIEATQRRIDYDASN
jgi:2,3-bisphosphoglycerate-dependent phosphoglycerate mutase/probable phosphoglycerate mutase